MRGSARVWPRRRSAISTKPASGARASSTGCTRTSSQTLTFYRAEEKRGAVPLELKSGVVVHDGFLPYGALRQVEHALCNAHHLRELKAR